MSYDSVLQTIGVLSTTIFLWIGANQVMSGHLTIGGFCLRLADRDGLQRDHANARRCDHMQFATVLLNRLDDCSNRNRSRAATELPSRRCAV